MFDIIYDIGANQGQNITYFLTKSKIVAVEPIENLCQNIIKNFKIPIENGQLKILNCAVVDKENIKKTKFYINNQKNWESSILPKNITKPIYVKALTLSTLIQKFGMPDCLKLDVEGYDIEILKYMLSNSIFPKYLVIEIQNKETLQYLLKNFDYKKFNIVLGHRVSLDYEKIKLFTHSSGPLATDLKCKWVNKFLIKLYFKISNYGWIDLHCTNEEYYDYKMLGFIKTLAYLLNDRINRKIKPIFSKLTRKLRSRLKL